MLSTRFGYLRPAFLAAALADAFCAGVSFFDLPNDLGRGFSHTGLLLFLFAANLFLLSRSIVLSRCRR